MEPTVLRLETMSEDGIPTVILVSGPPPTSLEQVASLLAYSGPAKVPEEWMRPEEASNLRKWQEIATRKGALPRKP